MLQNFTGNFLQPNAFSPFPIVYWQLSTTKRFQSISYCNTFKVNGICCASIMELLKWEQNSYFLQISGSMADGAQVQLSSFVS
jgi:hypothetical protein